MIWLLAQGKRVREVAEVTGYCANWIRILARRYNQDGPAVLADQRQHNRGAPPLLTGEHQRQLEHILAQAPPDGGLWTGPKVAHWMSQQLGRKVHPQHGWDSLKRVGFSLQTPRPCYHKADPTQQEAFKRNLPEQVHQIQQAHPHAQVELWAMDEHRVGLKPIIRRIWASRGHHPVIRVQQRYEWLYVYGFMQPETGASHWLLLPSVNVEVFSIAWQHFAQAIGAGSQRHILLVLDRAGWHESCEVAVPEGIHLVFLPPTPRSCNPVSTSGRSPTRPFQPSLREVQAERCVVLQDDPLHLRRHTLFHWWPLSNS